MLWRSSAVFCFRVVWTWGRIWLHGLQPRLGFWEKRQAYPLGHAAKPLETHMAWEPRMSQVCQKPKSSKIIPGWIWTVPAIGGRMASVAMERLGHNRVSGVLPMSKPELWFCFCIKIGNISDTHGDERPRQLSQSKTALAARTLGLPLPLCSIPWLWGCPTSVHVLTTAGRNTGALLSTITESRRFPFSHIHYRYTLDFETADMYKTPVNSSPVSPLYTPSQFCEIVSSNVSTFHVFDSTSQHALL